MKIVKEEKHALHRHLNNRWESEKERKKEREEED